MDRRPGKDLTKARMSISDRIRIKTVRPLSNGHLKLNAVTFDWRREDGQWQSLTREVVDRGGAAALLPYNLKSRTVVLVKQFRYAAYANGYDGLLIEAAAGLLDGASAEERIRLEAEEETGYRLHDVQKIFEAFMSPGALAEKIHFFVAEYEPAMRISAGGGLADEGEEIEVLELPIDEALAMIESGGIIDGKTIMMLQYAALKIFR
jgi:nudix-type nucleoside diphosphatase (YffH/AdpP family)